MDLSKSGSFLSWEGKSLGNSRIFGDGVVSWVMAYGCSVADA